MRRYVPTFESFVREDGFQSGSMMTDPNNIVDEIAVWFSEIPSKSISEIITEVNAYFDEHSIKASLEMHKTDLSWELSTDLEDQNLDPVQAINFYLKYNANSYVDSGDVRALILAPLENFLTDSCGCDVVIAYNPL